MAKDGIGIAVVGMGFGRDFVPIYQAHPRVGTVGICDPDAARLDEIGDRFGVERRHTSLQEVLEDEAYDAVHLLSPVPLHVEQTLAALAKGKHVACAVPMATSLDDLHRIVAEVRRTGLRYMMMETGAYTREFFYARDLYESGEMGTLTFLRGTYFQDLEGGFPDYWRAQPPMHYATHAIGPILALTKTRVERVNCLGSGRLRDDIQMPGGNPFPLQTAIMRLEGTNLAAEVTKSWFQVARAYTEAFSVYGEKKGFEWQQMEDEDPILYTLEPNVPGHRGRHARAERVSPPYRPDLLPAELAPFAAGGHGGSHPHLVHEFVSCIVEGRPSAIDEIVSADWTAPGICADLSSQKEGETVAVPTFG
ncbi:Gfo/Idh/MocA family oxidoreductase [bacterium]|nr:MAG: Gfo/Idh/MocA family oxidoreductase [bacterium]